MSEEQRLVRVLDRVIILVLFLILCMVVSCLFHLGLMADWFTFYDQKPTVQSPAILSDYKEGIWQAPGLSSIPSTAEGALIHYGRELIEHTAVYLGPKGKVASVSNGMNCQNCHLEGGTKPFGNNYGAVATKYPTFRDRSGQVENFEKRVNDCFQRSLNGKGLDTGSREMKAIVAYLKWVGKDVVKGEYPTGFGLVKLSLPERPADPVKGKAAYAAHCASCHGDNGEGVMMPNNLEWKYPPLWGGNSYNTGAGLYRISKFASFIKGNMPYGITYENPLLSDEQSWDIAAYVNSMPRPQKDLSEDWPDISKKPVDHPLGPYADDFTELDHKYGPYAPILEARGKQNN